MKIKLVLLSVIIYVLFSCLFLSCKSSTAIIKDSTTPLPAPSRNLSASQIMRIESIISIHYVDYDSVIINRRSNAGFTPEFEYHIDANRIRTNQYYLGTPDWNISVCDMNKKTMWNYYDGKLTYYPLSGDRGCNEGDIQAYLGSWLTEPQKFVRSDTIDDKICDVFTDSVGIIQEWVWRDHRLPIQRRRAEGYSGIFQITYLQKRNIEINVPFSESLFTPPK